MKDKKKETFPDAPPMPTEVKRASELRKREELEKLEEADVAGRRTGITFTPGTKIDTNAPLPTGDGDLAKPPITDTTTKPIDTTPDKPPVVKPIVPPSTPKPKADPPPDKTDGGKRKGKKGDG